MAMSADLGSNLEAVVENLVKTGRYGSKSEVLREGVRLVQERELALAELIAKLEEGIADLDAGNSLSEEEVFGELEARFQRMTEDEDRRIAEERNAAKV